MLYASAGDIPSFFGCGFAALGSLWLVLRDGQTEPGVLQRIPRSEMRRAL